MFDIGFSELLVIGVVALIVIGPEKLPRVARTVGVLAGRLQRYVADVKADINREIELEELRKMRDSMHKAATDFQSSVQSEINATETDLNKSVEDLNKSVDAVADWREAKPAEASPAEKKPEEENKPAL
jgi:sec-independent protein translocase protein TatB